MRLTAAAAAAIIFASRPQALFLRSEMGGLGPVWSVRAGGDRRFLTDAPRTPSTGSFSHSRPRTLRRQNDHRNKPASLATSSTYDRPAGRAVPNADVRIVRTNKRHDRSTCKLISRVAYDQESSRRREYAPAQPHRKRLPNGQIGRHSHSPKV